MPEVAAIGEEASLLAFKALGARVFPVKDSREAEQVLRELAARVPPFGVILIAEELAEDLAPVVSEVARTADVAISFVPGSSGSLGLGRERMRGLVRRAIGAEL